MKLHLGQFFLSRAVLTCAVACLLGSHVSFGAPVFSYSFPASWNGTGTAIVDQSAAAHNGVTNATLALSASVPPGVAAGTQSISTTGGGIVTSAAQLLTNPIIAAAGGYAYDVDFFWDGTDSTSNGHVQKIIDYAGTESLQLTTTAGSAQLAFIFTTQGVSPAPDTAIGPAATIVPNTWYQVHAEFDTLGDVVAGDGSLAGFANLSVTNLTTPGSPDQSGLAVTKTTYGDTLNRPIGIGELGSTFGHIVFLRGQIYNPSVSLVPEPASLVLLSLAGILGVARRQRLLA
ncbi:MAG TPA: PEP-CTERM sorting domain-containing protein [Lacipirellulaceae bacterium]|jgi:hypothetical protein|nr:PEP-CTERM sorting domain-containing protein [Lacipirellulaceae bacterium]